MTAASILIATGQIEVSVFDGGPDTCATAAGRNLRNATSSADHVQS